MLSKNSRAKCIECSTCHAYFSPNKFIFHFHKTEGATYRHPDAANFNSWRRHLFLCETDQRSETVLHAWEDLKAMFNGGCRRRPSRTVVQNEAQGGATQLTASTSAETPGYCTPALRTNGFPGPVTSDPFCGAIPCPPTRPHTGFALSKSSSISYGEFLRSLSRPYSSNWLTTPSRFGAYVTPVYPSPHLGPPLAHFQTNFLSRDPLGGSLARNVPSPIEAERRHRARHQADYHTNQPNAPSARSVFFNEGDLNTEENLSPSSLHLINPVSDDISTDEVRAESAEAPLDVENIVDRNDDKTDEQCVSCIAVEINNDEAKDFEVSGDADKLKNSHNIDSSPLSKETDEMGNMNSDELLRILDEKSDIGDFLKLSRDTLCTLVQSTRDSLEALDNSKTALQASIHLQSVKSKKVHAELTRDLDELKGTLTSDIEKERNLKDSLEGKIAEVNRLLHLTMPLSGYHSFG